MKRQALLWVAVPVFSTLYQLTIKLAAQEMGGAAFSSAWLAQAAATPWLWVAVVSEMAAFGLWLKILATCDLSKAFPLSAVSYVLILAASWVGFHEPLYLMQILGSALILAGVWMICTVQEPDEV